MMRRINKFQKLVVWSIIWMMVVVIFSATLEVGWIIVSSLATPPYLLFQVEKVLDVFSLFFIIVIGIELLETIKMILDESMMNVGIIILVGLTAIVRKILIIDIKDTNPLFLAGMGILIVALAAAYYLVVISGNNFKCSLNDE
ncbi:phosphate-starvation-inducible PsiE family protein [Methanolobus sp. ZRKC3]|uniref:phosphate-starvation-inducible PsiE family protein n=1 Tax=Methanolobus sp. ZRKC3 TaxID=3125786 RepID=UPI00324AC07E